MDWKDEFVTKAHNLIFRKYDSKLVAVSSDHPVSPYWFLQTDIAYDMEFHEANNGVPFCHRLCYSSSGGKGECETYKEAFGEFLEKHSGLEIEWVDEYDFKLGDITFEHHCKTGEMSLTPVTETKHNPVYNVSNITGSGQKVPYKPTIEDPSRTLEEIQTELARVRVEIKETGKEIKRYWLNNRIDENDHSVKIPYDLKEKRDDLRGELFVLFEHIYSFRLWDANQSIL
jgi:hypothetical protein